MTTGFVITDATAEALATLVLATLATHVRSDAFYPLGIEECRLPFCCRSDVPLDCKICRMKRCNARTSSSFNISQPSAVLRNLKYQPMGEQIFLPGKIT